MVYCRWLLGISKLVEDFFGVVRYLEIDEKGRVPYVV